MGGQEPDRHHRFGRSERELLLCVARVCGQSVIADVRVPTQSVGVIAFGTILGHGLCTFGAVMGGRWLSTIISVRHSEWRASITSVVPRSQLTMSIPHSVVTLLGAAAFLIFASLYLYEAWTGSGVAEAF
jgi:putative Ca2+/H+ antiporter (TMEM165/GDT1 family)